MPLIFTVRTQSYLAGLLLCIVTNAHTHERASDIERDRNASDLENTPNYTRRAHSTHFHSCRNYGSYVISFYGTNNSIWMKQTTHSNSYGIFRYGARYVRATCNCFWDHLNGDDLRSTLDKSHTRLHISLSFFFLMLNWCFSNQNISTMRDMDSPAAIELKINILVFMWPSFIYNLRKIFHSIYVVARINWLKIEWSIQCAFS